MTTSNQRELQQGGEEFERYFAEIRRRELSRRVVLKAGVAASLIGAGGIAALLGACGDDDGATATPAATTAGGTPRATATAPQEAVTGAWDTTGTPPYKNGLSDAVAKPDAKWQQYPWQYKYGPWRYNWNVPVTRGGQIIIAFPPYADFNLMISGISSQPTNNKLFNAALREGADLLTPSIEPDLAIGQSNTPDYTSWTFKIPANAKFQNKAPVNGRLLTAADVVFSFERIIENSVNKATLANVAKITAVDATTVKFDMKAPAVLFPRTLASPHLPVFSKEAYENQDFFKKNPIGTGPFFLEFSEFQNRADWVRNPGYWQLPPIKPEKYGKGALPMVDKYTRPFFANNVTAKEAFFQGQIDTFQPGCGVDPALIKEQLQRVPEAILSANPYWSCCPLGILFQYKNPLFQDIRVRKALSMSIDRQLVWEKGMDKTGVFGASPMPFDFQDQQLPTPLKDFGDNVAFNIDKAKALLKEAGISLPIKLQLYIGTGLPTTWQGAIDTVVFTWKQAGIVDATVVVRDGQVFAQDQVNKSFPELLFTGAGSNSFGYSLDAAVTPAYLTGSPRNYGSLADPALDDLFKKWAALTDPAQAPVVAKQIAKQFVDNLDHLWIGWIGGLEVTQPWLHGMVISAHNCVNGIGLGNMKYPWIGANAPGGRGGKPIV